MSTALAIFVKTPGLSPIKTRLAAGIGIEQAEQFHALAADAVAAVARKAMPLLEPYWAVAEAEALNHPHWANLPTLAQGEGDLGARLNTICSALQARHGSVLLVGADCPQVTVDLLHQAVHALASAPTTMVIGRARDGGFWLFGTRVPIAASVWQQPTYSTDSTADQLVAALSPSGALCNLPTLTDIDRAEDLAALAEALHALPSPVPEQRALQTWLHNLPAAQSNSDRAAR